MVSLRYALTKDDYSNYYTYVMWDAPVNKKKRVIYYTRQVMPLLIFLVAFYYTGLFNRPGNFILMIAGFFILTSFLAFFGVRNNMMKQGEKVANDPDNSSVFLNLEVTVSDTGLTVKDELKEVRYQWMAFIKKLESQNYYFLFHNSIQAIIIPKRVFRNAEEKTKFEKLLNQYLTFDADISHLLKH